MKIEMVYGSDVLSLPKKVILAKLGEAELEDLAVLLTIASDDALRSAPEDNIARAAESLGMAVSRFESAIAFWRGAGAIRTSGKAKAPKVTETAKEPPEKAEKPLQKDELPDYSGEEIASFVEGNAGMKSLIDACQQSLGKIFNVSDVRILVGMCDHLSLDHDYILTLIAYCARIGKRSMRYIEKMAITLHDEDVDSTAALEDYIKRAEAGREAEGKIRALFGMGSRAMSAKEKRIVAKWTTEWNIDFSLIERAFDITVDKIHEPSLPYTNGILEKWRSAGYETAQDVDRALEEYKQNKPESGSSFDTDEFFELALSRTYGTADK